MKTAETIQAAIDRLTELRNERAYVEFNGWLAEPNTGDTARYPLEPRNDLVPVTNDALIVTLHRTIDAQLAILRDNVQAATEYPSCDEPGGVEHAYALARAILGGDS